MRTCNAPSKAATNPNCEGKCRKPNEMNAYSTNGENLFPKNFFGRDVSGKALVMQILILLIFFLGFIYPEKLTTPITNPLRVLLRKVAGVLVRFEGFLTKPLLI